MDDRELLRRLHDWFLEAAPEHYAGCGLYFDVNESLAAAPEPLRVAEGPEIVAALTTAQTLMMGSGYWRNEAGYLTDAALWIERAISAAEHLSGEEVERLRDAAEMFSDTGEGGILVAQSVADEHAADLRSVLAIIDARPPTSEEVEALCERLNDWAEGAQAEPARFGPKSLPMEAAAMIRRLALIEPSAGGGWRPIETAPKDKGPIVVASSPEDWTTAEAVWRDGEWRAACWFAHRASSHFESREHVVKPVYWQPRPVRSTPDQPKQEVKDV